MTHDGTGALPHAQATQADDGTILAVRGGRFERYDRHGNRLGRPMGSVLSGRPAGAAAFGPWEAKISPDGTKVAYWLGIMGGWYGYGTATYYDDPQSAVVYQSAIDGSQLGSTMFYEEPSWLGDSQHVLLFDSSNAATPQAVVGAVGATHNQVQGWFHDRDTGASSDPFDARPVGAGELSRDGRRLAALRAGGTSGAGYEARGSHNGIQLYDVSTLSSAPAAWPCWIHETGGAEMGPPSFSPSGDAIAWATADGIWITSVAGGCGALDIKLAIPGGREPDWGPADPGTDATQPPPPHHDKAPQLAGASAVGRSVLMRTGLALRVTCPVACDAGSTARYKRVTVAAGRAPRKVAGTATLRLRPTQAARRALRGARAGNVAVTVRPPGSAPRVLRRTVRLRA